MDLVTLGDWISQPAVGLQLTNGSPCYCVHIETKQANGFIGRSADIAIVPLHRYSFSLLFDEINGLAKLAIFDPSNNFTQGGSTVTFPQTAGSTFIMLRFGNAEAGTSSGTTAYFENLMLDWTNHIFPNTPLLGFWRTQLANAMVDDGWSNAQLNVLSGFLAADSPWVDNQNGYAVWEGEINWDLQQGGLSDQQVQQFDSWV